MFNSKLTRLFDVPTTSETTNGSSKNSFLQSGLQESAKTRSGNNALKYDTTGDPFVDQFGVMGSYKEPRPFSEIERDCEILWGENPLLAVKFAIYLRMITRRTVLSGGRVTEEPQRGGELKHEAIMRMIWLHSKAPETFWSNITLFISVGSWKDIFTMLRYDLEYHGWDNRVLDWDKFSQLIISGLMSKGQVDLIKKYLPQIKAKSKCTTIHTQANTIIGKWLASAVYPTRASSSSYKLYRKSKSSGTAHTWQQKISREQFSEIDFDEIHGRALSRLVNSKFLENQGLKQKYEQWISSEDTNNVKYTGFVHELFQNADGISRNSIEAKTINKQFKTLVEKGRSKIENTRLIVVRDTSGSMRSFASGTKMSCGNIAKALALYFSEFLTGEFANSWIEFNRNAKMHTWNGSTPFDKWRNDNSHYIGSTNFQSVIELFCDIKRSGVQEEEFPTGILCISDGEFNQTSLDTTNVQAARTKLRNAGFSDEYVENFIIVLWNLQSNYYGKNTGKKFETYGNVPNVFYFGGYSAATVSFLTGDIKNARGLFDEAMKQEVLQMVAL